ncbi:regulator of microtubule dynamics protein 1-like [Osmia bicornis bicornis]|uniref:regulator of microtubule dynamics protein 1-like n=1 Tax=Osmia bicornis bicornis TaxID=1437191 RepID=UPI0010F4BE2F|nr:regulator of microtubule dynamics protein 1-like [Osmia bicornis bicornis]
MSLRKVLCFVRDAKILQRMFVNKNFLLSQKKNNQCTVATQLFTLSFTGMSIWSFTKNKSENEAVITTKEVLIGKADAMFDQEKYKEIYDLLTNYKDSGDVEIIWRLCRAMYKMSKTASDVEAKRLVYEAFGLILDALEINENHWAVQKWAAIILNAKCSYEGVKALMKESYNIKHHMLKAIELNANDATIMYMLGTWCYQVADLSWYQRKIAAIIFGEPPTSSFQEALIYFESAEKVDPYFYSHNLLMLAKTYLKLNNKEQAMKYLKMAVEYPAKNDDDLIAKQEAQKLLKNV